MTPPQLLTSSKEDWETPQQFWDRLDDEFFFDLDAAAHEYNPKCGLYLTEDDDALSNPWPEVIEETEDEDAIEIVSPYINPPYGKGNHMGKWMQQIQKQSMRSCYRQVVSLVASRTDTVWWHELVMPLADEVRFVRGRLLFEVDGKPAQHYDKRSGTMKNSPATFPSAVVVWRRVPQMRSRNVPLFTSMPAKEAA